MPRIPRLLVTDPRTAYHVISRTALDGFALGDTEKEHLLGLLKRLRSVYFAEVRNPAQSEHRFRFMVNTESDG